MRNPPPSWPRRRQFADSIGAITAALAAEGTADASAAAGDVGGTGVIGTGVGGNGVGGNGQRTRPYVRSASLFAQVADSLPEQGATSRPQLALRDLELLDGALAEAAHWAGVPVTDLDTVPLSTPARN